MHRNYDRREKKKLLADFEKCRPLFENKQVKEYVCIVNYEPAYYTWIKPILDLCNQDNIEFTLFTNTFIASKLDKQENHNLRREYLGIHKKEQIINQDAYKRNKEVDYIECFIALLKEYFHLLELKCNVDLKTGSPDDKIAKEIKASLDAAEITPSISMPKRVFDWYEDLQVKDMDDRMRCSYLHELFYHLNEQYAAEPLQKLSSNIGTVIIGREWWRTLEKTRGEKDLSKNNKGFSYFSPFPHIRLMPDGNTIEWIEQSDINHAFHPIKNTKSLRIGLCALSGNARTRFKPSQVIFQEDIHGFYAESIVWENSESTKKDDKDHYLLELQECLDWAKNKDVNILCFPELSVCPAGREIIKKEIEKNPGRLCLIIPGSFHKESKFHKNKWINSAPLWIVVDKKIKEILLYKKREVFKTRVLQVKESPVLAEVVKAANNCNCTWLQEDIISGNKIFLINTPVGIISFVICKDALGKEICKLPMEFADHLFIIAMNFGDAWFNESAKRNKHYYTGTFYVNATQVVSSLDNKVEVVFWNVPCHSLENKECYYYRDHKVLKKKLPESGNVLLPPLNIPKEMLQWLDY